MRVYAPKEAYSHILKEEPNEPAMIYESWIEVNQTSGWMTVVLFSKAKINGRPLQLIAKSEMGNGEIIGYKRLHLRKQLLSMASSVLNDYLALAITLEQEKC